MPTHRLFRHNAYDALPALCAIFHVALLVGTFALFHRLPVWLLGLAFCVIVFNYCWNVQSISHNFIHNAFFTSAWLNRAFSLLESVGIGVPQTIYYHYHLNHHWGDNDAKGPDGTTKDWGSTYRHGKGNDPESFWSYRLVGFFRFARARASASRASARRASLWAAADRPRPCRSSPRARYAAAASSRNWSRSAFRSFRISTSTA